MWAVLDYTETRTITRELLLVKVSILGPEYLEEQLLGGPTHDPRRSTPDSMGGGEDAKLNVWTAAGAEPAMGSPTGKAKRWNDVDPMDVDEDGDGSSRKKRRA